MHAVQCLSSAVLIAAVSCPLAPLLAACAPARRLCLATLQPQVPSGPESSNSQSSGSSASASTHGIRRWIRRWVGEPSWADLAVRLAMFLTLTLFYVPFSLFGTLGKVVWWLMPVLVFLF